jgi:hypothetical protein
MSKIYPIESCIGCGVQIKPLIRENQEEWEELRTFVVEKPKISKDKFMDILTPRLMVNDKADVVYCLCSDCCKNALSQFLTQLIARHRRILSWDFDKLRKELKE